MKRLFYIIPLILLFISLIFWGIRRGEDEQVLLNASMLCLSCIGLK
ncbi:hypothetical protein LR066_02785 [candidate division WOR-3 bacterium]|nr:hypothetical protein [candidate division WOR-3 bacterium]